MTRRSACTGEKVLHLAAAPVRIVRLHAADAPTTGRRGAATDRAARRKPSAGARPRLAQSVE